jgi:peptide chain release factor 2
MENLLKNLEELREKVLATMRLLEIDRQKEEATELKIETEKPSFWNDRERAIEVGKKIEELEREVSDWEELLKSIRDLEELVAVAVREKDSSLDDEVQVKYLELKEKFSKLEFFVMFHGKYDQSNAIISIHAGTGGVDAQDWAMILERMYLRFAEKHNWKATIIDRTVGNEAGIKSSSIKIAGRWTYGYLRGENGVHRLVRISPFDAESMRHTSFALVEVIPELPEAETIEIKDEDLRIDVFRSSGPGGQSVNTTDSAVRIVHKPTGITVTCQTERSQHQNKEIALKILKSKLFKLEEESKENEERKMRGEAQKAEWGKQIRSYVMQPYQMVKDHRTEEETSDIKNVLDGDIDKFVEAYLRKSRNA